MNTVRSFDSAAELVRAWVDAVNGRKLDEVLGLYATEARLMPTFSPHLLRNDAGRRQYFENLVRRPGLEVTLHENTLLAEKVGGRLEVASGIYRFAYLIDDVPLIFEARYSFFADLAAAAPILHHHSSQIPRNLS